MVGERFDQVGQRFDRVEQRRENLENGQTRLENAVRATTERLDDHGLRIEHLEQEAA